MLTKTTIATMKSGAFLASFVMLYQYQICGHRNLIKAGFTTVNSKYLYWLAGFVCSYASIFFEDKRRRTELALYVLPKALKSFYEICYQRKWIIRVQHFEVIMASFAMGVIMVSVLLKHLQINRQIPPVLNKDFHSRFIKMNQMCSHPLSVKSCINSSRKIRHADNTILHTIIILNNISICRFRTSGCV